MSAIPKLRDVIMNTTEPLLIKDILKWDLLKWDLYKWTNVLNKEQLVFRLGKNSFTQHPQFENTTSTIKLSFEEFLNCQESNPQEWLYFDYKYLKEWLLNIPELQNNIDWSDFGFPELNFEDSTIWIGSKGAHTPCHVDTYGCNIIAQIYGRKQWILFPPEEDLRPTRIPYEESSVYSRINFFTPCSEDFKDIKNCHTIILNPGDVLILPHRWWHYVENLDMAISINTWIKLPIDHEERIGESVVHLLISQMIKQLDPELQQKLVNPSSSGEQTLLIKENIMNSLLIVQTCLDNYKMEKQFSRETISIDFKEILRNMQNIKIIEKLSEENLQKMIESRKERFPERNKDSEEKDCEFEKIFDAVLHNDVVNLIKQKLLEK